MAEKCSKCDGCGKIANDDDQSPWTFWEQLPPGSDIAVRMGLVKPIACPKCGGSGEAKEA
jgi:hypothetical protein